MKKTLLTISLFTSLNLLAIDQQKNNQEAFQDKNIEKIKHILDTRFSTVDLPSDSQESDNENISFDENDLINIDNIQIPNSVQTINQNAHNNTIRPSDYSFASNANICQTNNTEKEDIFKLYDEIKKTNPFTMDTDKKHKNEKKPKKEANADIQELVPYCSITLDDNRELELIGDTVQLDGKQLFKLGRIQKDVLSDAMNSSKMGDYDIHSIHQMNMKLKQHKVKIIIDKRFNQLSITNIEESRTNAKPWIEKSKKIAEKIGFEFNRNYNLFSQNVKINDKFQLIVNGIECATFTGGRSLCKRIAVLARLIMSRGQPVSWLEICNIIGRDPMIDTQKALKIENKQAKLKKQGEYRHKFIQLLRNDLAASLFTIEQVGRGENVSYRITIKK